jgi:hypothetical protein
MTTPTDDEIVAHVSYMAEDWTAATTKYVRQALRLAREGLPVPDEKAEARDIWQRALAAYRAIPDMAAGDRLIAMDDATDVIHKALAARDAERDAEVALAVEALSGAVAVIEGTLYELRLSTRAVEQIEFARAALAKLERKP